MGFPYTYYSGSSAYQYASGSASGGWVSGRTIFVPVYDDIYEFVLSARTSDGDVTKIESIRLTTSDAYQARFYGGDHTSFDTWTDYTLIETDGSSIDLSDMTDNTTKYFRIRYTGGPEGCSDDPYVVINESNDTVMPVHKIWSDLGYEDERPDSITFEAYNVLDETTVVGSVVLTADDAVADYEWAGVIRDLPRYNIDGSLAEYAIREIAVEGYHSVAKKPTGMYITFSKDTLSGYAGDYAGNTVPNRNYYIQVFSTDSHPNHMNMRYAYQYPGINEENMSGYLYKEDLEALNYRVYIPIQYDGDYSFVVCTPSNSSVVKTVKVESVELTADEVECIPVYYSGSNMPYEIGEYANNVNYSNLSATYKLYRGHGAVDMTGAYEYRYVYDGARYFSTNDCVKTKVNNVN